MIPIWAGRKIRSVPFQTQPHRAGEAQRPSISDYLMSSFYKIIRDEYVVEHIGIAPEFLSPKDLLSGHSGHGD